MWLIPLLAALVGGWLAVKAIIDRGPVITITFETAEGLEAGKTKLKYKDVDVGLVKTVALSPDAKRVIVIAEMVKRSEKFLVGDTRFWVVRARISGGSVTGLGTLLSGSYVGVDPGKSGKDANEFIGLNVPPAFSSDVPGTEFVLHVSNLGSLDIGSPVYFRRLQAGEVAAHALDKDGKGVTVKVFINAPYDKFVTANTRFWQASGIDVTLDASGIKIDTQSLVSILVGGLAFETPLESSSLPPAAAKTEFSLFGTRADALKNPETQLMKTVMVFSESVRGLAPGAPLDYRGIEIGNVTAIKVQLDPEKMNINIVVEADLYPARLSRRSITAAAAQDEAGRRAFLNAMIAKGLRAQLRTGNLLTGQLFVALDFFPNASKSRPGAIDGTDEFPTIRSSLSELQATLASLAKKIQDFPLQEVGTDLRATLQSATKMMQHVDAELTPEARDALADARKAIASVDRVLKPDSPLSQDAGDAMREVARAAAAFRVLADYLDQHPEALITGKKEDKK